jgi:hypothetical protein
MTYLLPTVPTVYRSLMFEPADLRYPILKFPYKVMHTHTYTDTYTHTHDTWHITHYT